MRALGGGVAGIVALAMSFSAIHVTKSEARCHPNCSGRQTSIIIGTGGVTGVYYPTGGAICRLVNRQKKQHGVQCSVESTRGSIHNIDGIRSGELELGIVQSDWQFHAYHGSSQFKDAAPFKELRAIFSVHAEPASIIARKDANITHVDQLVGKRVNIGNPGSGGEATWNVMWRAMGKTNGDLALAAQMKSPETPDALCDGKIDALFWLVGHPNVLSKAVTTSCQSIFVEISGPSIDKLVREHPYYRFAKIRGGMYRGNPTDVATFGVGATVVASTRTPPETIYHVVKAVFGNIGAFKKLHPAFADLKEREMISYALSAPLHEGAERYYKERGWIN